MPPVSSNPVPSRSAPPIGRRAVLDAWMDRSRWDAADGDDAGAADRRWSDLLPGMARHELCTDGGVAVSYLNVHERPLAIAGDGFTAGGVPLRLFRFIHFDHRRPALLTTIEATGPRRSLLSEDPALRLLCERRVAAVGAADDDPADVPYARDTLANGLRLAPAVREALREASRSADGALVLDARRVADTTSFLLAASEGLPRVARSIHDRRPDLAAAYPDPVGDPGDRAGLAAWWRNVAADELAIDRGLASRVALAIDDPLPRPVTASRLAGRHRRRGRDRRLRAGRAGDRRGGAAARPFADGRRRRSSRDAVSPPHLEPDGRRGADGIAAGRFVRRHRDRVRQPRPLPAAGP